MTRNTETGSGLAILLAILSVNDVAGRMVQVDCNELQRRCFVAPELGKQYLGTAQFVGAIEACFGPSCSSPVESLVFYTLHASEWLAAHVTFSGILRYVLTHFSCRKLGGSHMYACGRRLTRLIGCTWINCA